MEAIEAEVDGRTRRTIRFSSRCPLPDRWRTVTWEVGELEVAGEEQPIPSKS